MKDSPIWTKLEEAYESKTLQTGNQVCAQVTMMQPPASPPPGAPATAVTDISIGGVDCGTGGPCAGGLDCSTDNCDPPDVVDVVVTFANSGTADDVISPGCSVNGLDTGITPNEGVNITIPAGGSAIATFAMVQMPTGPNTYPVCVTW